MNSSSHPRSTRAARPFALHLHPLALAVHIGFGAAFLVVPALMPAAQAQSPAPERSYDIPAGPLPATLTRFAGESGIFLSGAADLAQGLSSPGVQGRHTVQSGLAALLAGTGLETQQDAQGQYVLRKAAAASAESDPQGSVLPAVKVSAQSDRGAPTEGTRSYTGGSGAVSTGLGLSLRETPQSVSVITRQRMVDQGLTQLTDVVNQTPGLYVSQSGNVGSDSSPIYSRGFSVDNYLIDGVKLLNSYSSIFQSQDMVLYDRAEIVRGATGLMNAAGSPGAAINLVRKRPTRAFQASARLDLGTWEYRRLEADVSTPLNASGSIRGRVVAAVQDAESYIDRFNEDRQVVFGVIEADLTPSTQVRFGASHQRHDSTGHSRGGRPAFFSDGTRTRWDRSDSAAAAWAYSERISTSYYAQIEHVLDNDWELRAGIARTITDSDELVGYTGGTPNRATGAGMNIWATHWAYKPKQDILDLSAKGPFELFGRKHDLAAGVTLARSVQKGDPSYTNWSHAGWDGMIPNIYEWDGTVPVQPANPAVGDRDADERSYGVYASVRLRPTDALSVIAGARVSDWKRSQVSRTYATGVTTSTEREENGEVIPYAGLVVDFSEHWSAYLSYTTIFQPQNNKTVTGDYLDPLLGNSREVGIKGAFYDNRLNVGAAVYEIEEDNKPIAIPDTFAPDGSQAYVGLSGTKSRGLELEVSGELRPTWQVSASFARNMTQDRLGLRLSTNIPQNTVKLFTTVRLPQIGNGLTVGGGVRWQSEIFSDNLGPLRVRFTQPAYAVVDLLARYPITPSVTASVNLFNTFDKVYYTTTGSSYYGAPRNLRAALDVKF